MTYKNRPLIRKDNILYFGSMQDKYIAMLQILSTTSFEGEEIADRVLIQLQLTDENALPKDRVEKASEKHGLYDALDIADIWLTRALKS